jgi:hypothetical protein
LIWSFLLESHQPLVSGRSTTAPSLVDHTVLNHTFFKLLSFVILESFWRFFIRNANNFVTQILNNKIFWILFLQLFSSFSNYFFIFRSTFPPNMPTTNPDTWGFPDGRKSPLEKENWTKRNPPWNSHPETKLIPELLVVKIFNIIWFISYN